MKRMRPLRWGKPRGRQPIPDTIRYLRPISSGRDMQQRFKPITTDLYHWLLVLSWPKFLAIIGGFYFGLNLAFAAIFMAGSDNIANARPGSFQDTFFFSIQTLSTVGYGSMYPQTLWAQIVVSVEIFVGLVSIAILTGLMFARFAKPTARVLFSDVAVVCPFEGIPTLMFRTANQRDNRILEAQIRVSVVQGEETQEGHKMRRFYDLPLLRSQTPVFGLSWLVMHPINENSPLWGRSPEELAAAEMELWISFTGLDESFSQTIHSRYAYAASDIKWGKRFVDIFHQAESGQWTINFEDFHCFEAYTESDVMPPDPETAVANAALIPSSPNGSC